MIDWESAASENSGRRLGVFPYTLICDRGFIRYEKRRRPLRIS